MSRPTVHDIAQTAGVSLATVDRVLNKRPGVRAKTILRVNEAIEKLGYVRDVAAANLARQRTYDFVCVMPDAPTEFLGELRDAVAEIVAQGAMDRVRVDMRTYPADDTHALAEMIGGLAKAPPDGLALMAPETPRVRDAVRRVMQAGASIVPMVADLPTVDCGHFVGIDNVAAGRTAGTLLGRFLPARPARVMVVAGTMTARDHAERRLGFDQVMAERFGHLSVLPTLECYDRAELVAARVSDMLARHEDIAAIYSAGAGNQGLVRALASADAGARLTVIAHELTECTRAALTEGTFDAVIAQNPGHIVRSALRVLRAEVDGMETIPSQERIRTEIFLKENLP
ncbi:MAG: LacI family DNA-binding transcriptional regulator [Roseitalea porphyridii]|jgi:LacI family transcriptional regulator|uniref:LacI family DNA-binding transcriptional regulator n=1 Tax=Hyphomicrobiales TaxID=356 RepID=UPI0032EBB861